MGCLGTHRQKTLGARGEYHFRGAGVLFPHVFWVVHTPADVAGRLRLRAWCWLLVPVPDFPKSEKKSRGSSRRSLPLRPFVSLGAVLYVELYYPWARMWMRKILASAVKKHYTMLGCALGVLVGQPIERRYVKF